MTEQHQARRPWVKLWTQEYIHGTTRQELLPDERSVWIDFMALAGDSPKLGFICIAENVGYSHDQLAQLLRVDLELLERTISKCVTFEKIRTNGDNIIEVVNFWKYQPQFDRTDYQREYMHEYRKRKRKTNKHKSHGSDTHNG